jgi:hypothetical protein
MTVRMSTHRPASIADYFLFHVLCGWYEMHCGTKRAYIGQISGSDVGPGCGGAGLKRG